MRHLPLLFSSPALCAFSVERGWRLPESEGWIGQWSPGIGDPSFAGWLTVVAYFVAAFVCWRARRIARDERPRATGLASARFWSVLAVGLTMLGVNKQLDLQTAVTEIGRILARQQGWYDHRRWVQMAFIVLVILIVAMACRWLLRAAAADLSRLWLAVVGAAVLGAFVAIRASSFHHVDACIWFDLLFGLRVNVVLELGGICCISVAALRFQRLRRAVTRRDGR